MGKPKPPTYAEIISKLLIDVRQPITIDGLIDKFLEIRVPQTKKPRSSVRNKIREENGRLLIFVDDDQIIPIEIAYRNVHFRIRLTRKMLFKGILPLDEFGYYFIGKLRLDELKFLDEEGSVIDAAIFSTTKKLESFWGIYDKPFLA